MAGKRSLLGFLLALCVSAMPARAMAQTAIQHVTVRVNAVSRVALSPAAGSYAIVTNASDRKITAALDESLPRGVVVEVALSAPRGATSVGLVPLRTTAVDVVTGIAATAADGLPIRYRMSGARSAPATARESPRVVFTVIAAP